MDWRIYYGDGSTYDNSMGTPQNAPPLDVQIIVLHDKKVGRQMLHLWDWYYWSGTEWCGADIYGLLDQLMHNGVTAVKQGRTLAQTDFDKIYQRALADKDFAPRSNNNYSNREKKNHQVWGDGESF